MINFIGERHANCLRKARAEWSGTCLEHWQEISVRVPLQARAKLAQSSQFLDRKVTRVSHGGIKHRADMAIRKHKPVSLRPIRFFWLMPQGVEEEHRENICHIKRSSDVAGAGVFENIYYRNANLIRSLFQFFYFVVSECHSALNACPTISLVAPASITCL